MQNKKLLYKLCITLMILLSSVLVSGVYEDFDTVICNDKDNGGLCHFYDDPIYQTLNNSEDPADLLSLNNGGWGTFGGANGYYEGDWLKIVQTGGNTGYNITLNETSTDYKMCFTINHSFPDCNAGLRYALHIGTAPYTDKSWGCSNDDIGNFWWWDGASRTSVGRATAGIKDICFWYNSTMRISVNTTQHFDTGDSANPFTAGNSLIFTSANNFVIKNVTMWNKLTHGFMGDGIFEDSPSDTTPPTITTDLINNSVYGDDIDFYVSIDEVGSCSVNNSLWTNTPDVNLTYFEFTDIGSIDQDYSLLLSCNDTALNNDIAIYDFTRASPIVTIEYPLNNTNVDDDPFNVTFNFDNINPMSCGLYINLTENFTIVANITTGEINITSSINVTNETINTSDKNAMYRFEEGSGTTTLDLINGNNGTLNSATYTTSKLSNGTGNYSLNFVNAYVQVPYSSFMSYGTLNDFSISAWIKSTHGGDGSYHMITDNRDAGSDGVFFAIASDDTIQLVVNDVTMASSTTITDNDWHFLVAVVDRDSSTESDIWIDGVAESVGVATDTKNIAVTNDFYIGQRSFSAGIYWEGQLDEIYLWNKTLSDSEIADLYERGIINLVNVTVENTTTINQTLNQSQNYSLSYTFPSDTKESYDYYINCTDSTDIIAYHNMFYDNDFTSPVITMSFPNSSQENSAYNFNLWLNFTTSENSICTVNATDFNDTGTYETNFNLMESTLNNSLYNFNLSCVDSSIHQNSVYQIINITKDKEFPYVDFIFPLEDNATEVINDGVLEIVFNTSDNIDLYSVHWNITRASDDIIFFEEELNISGLMYLVEKDINVANWSNATYELNVMVHDSHTKKKIKDFKKIDKNIDNILFQMNEKSYVKISTNNNKVKGTNSKKKSDRYEFGFEYNSGSGEKEYIIESNGVIDYLPESNYKGHFVILTSEGSYWLDFENLNNYPVDVRKENDSYIVSLLDTGDNISFSSIGELNTFSRSTRFELTALDEDYNTDIIAGTNWFNTAILNPTSVAGVLLYMFLFLILVASIVLAEITQIPFIAILSSFLGITYSILIFTTISSIFGGIIAVLSVMYIFRSIIMFKS